jgi:hypothetical protein
MDFIGKYTNVLSTETCQSVCEVVDEILSREDPGSGVRFSNDKSRVDYNIFSSRYGSLIKYEDEIINAVRIAWQDYNLEYDITTNHFSRVFDKGWKIQRSETGGGFHSWHYEQGPGVSKGRFAVWMIYLNTVEQGGKTQFLNQKLDVKPEEGTLLIWPAAYTHIHRAAPDLVGKKYIATGWFKYPDREYS